MSNNEEVEVVSKTNDDSMLNSGPVSIPIPQSALTPVKALKASASPILKIITKGTLLWGGIWFIATLPLSISISKFITGENEALNVGLWPFILVLALNIAGWVFLAFLPSILELLFPSSYRATGKELDSFSARKIISADLLQRVSAFMSSQPDRILQIDSATNAAPGFLMLFGKQDTIVHATPVSADNENYTTDISYFTYSNIMYAAATLDNVTITKGGGGSAALGGILFGGPGMIAGAVLGKKNTTSETKKAVLHIAFIDTQHHKRRFIEISLSPPPDDFIWWSNFLAAHAETNKID